MGGRDHRVPGTEKDDILLLCFREEPVRVLFDVLPEEGGDRFFVKLLELTVRCPHEARGITLEVDTVGRPDEVKPPD